MVTFVVVCCAILLNCQLIYTYSVEDDALVYTSIPEMVTILNTASKLLERTEELRAEYEKEIIDASGGLGINELYADSNSNILHPISLLKTILDINNILKSKKEYVEQISNIHDDFSYFTMKKLKLIPINVSEHVENLFQLQDFYNFDTSEAADGNLHGSSTYASLSALDCYKIGVWALKNHDAYHAKLWLQEAKRRLNPKSTDKTIAKEEILLKLATVYSVYKDKDAALREIKEVLTIDPDNKEALQFKASFYSQIESDYKVAPFVQNWGRTMNATLVQNLCLQERLDKSDPDTICYYQSIYPYYCIKIEVISSQPAVVIVHDVMTEQEVSGFHQQANLQNRFGNAMNHSTVIYPESNMILQIFKKKVAAFANSIDVSDPFLYTHFDLGEFHQLKFNKPVKNHKSFSAPDDKTEGFLSMFFLNAVEGGGKVIFPLQNISVTPEKGNGILWEIQPEETDNNVLHTVCPVYVGNLTVVYIHGK